MRFVPFIGVLLASPVIVQAVQGQRPVHEALATWLVAMLLGLAGCWLWSAATRPSTVVPLEVVPLEPERRRRPQDRQ